MNAKAIILVALVAMIAVDQSEGWKWWKKAVKTVKKIVTHPVVHTIGKAVLKWDGMKVMRQLDNDEFEDAMERVSKDLENDFDENELSQLLDLMTQIRDLTDDEFVAFEHMSDEATFSSDERSDALARAFVRSLARQ